MNKHRHPFTDTLRWRISEVINGAARRDSRYTPLMEFLGGIQGGYPGLVFGTARGAELKEFLEAWWHSLEDGEIPPEELEALTELPDADIAELGRYTHELTNYDNARSAYYDEASSTPARLGIDGKVIGEIPGEHGSGLLLVGDPFSRPLDGSSRSALFNIGSGPWLVSTGHQRHPGRLFVLNQNGSTEGIAWEDVGSELKLGERLAVIDPFVLRFDCSEWPSYCREPLGSADGASVIGGAVVPVEDGPGTAKVQVARRASGMVAGLRLE